MRFVLLVSALVTSLWLSSNGRDNPIAQATEPAVFLVIDEDSIDNGNPPNRFTARQVNDDIAEIGVRAQLRYFAANVGKRITLQTGQIGDEGWFELRTPPASWEPAGGLAAFIGDPAAPPKKPPPAHGVGPGLGAPDANGDREALLDKVPDVTPLHAADLDKLIGRSVCAVVYDSDVSINYGPLTGSLKGANLGTVAFRVESVGSASGSSSLPAVAVVIEDARETCAQVGGGDGGGAPD